MPSLPLDRLKHIRDECAFLVSQTQGMTLETFLADEIHKRAFARSLEVIGEAAKQVPFEFRQQHPELPWRVMAGMRDRLIHDYTGVLYRVVWQTATEDVPPLIKKIEAILKSNPGL